jgi:hypothetical protein
MHQKLIDIKRKHFLHFTMFPLHEGQFLWTKPAAIQYLIDQEVFPLQIE